MTNLVTINLDELRAELAKKRQELAELEAAERFAVAYGKQFKNGHTNGSAVDVIKKPAGVIVAPDEVSGKTVHDAAFVVLTRAGKKMRTAEVVAVLKAAKFGEHIANLQASVFTALDRKKNLFRKVDSGVWELAASAKASE